MTFWEAYILAGFVSAGISLMFIASDKPSLADISIKAIIIAVAFWPFVLAGQLLCRRIRR